MQKKLALVFFTFYTLCSYAQEDLKPSLIPPHPDAAALGRYGDITFSAYTGSPSVSIPLYEIQYNDLRIPLVMNYDASGVKVSQQASWVGLNWSLNAGGVVTRSVRSLYDDDATYSYKQLTHATIDAITSGQVFNGTTLTTAKNLSNRVQDGEPDIYFFNFNGRAGKFIETPEGFFAIDRQDLRIQKLNGWIITDENGFTYKFSESENTRPNNYKDIRDFTSAWYLTSIESPNGAIARFYYKSGGRERTPNQRTLSYDVEYNPAGQPSEVTNNRTQTSYSYILDRRILERIVFPSGEVFFSTQTGRLDIQTSDAYGTYSSGHALSSIEVRTGNGTPKRYFRFLYDYFHDGQETFDNYRLKLNRIIEAPNSTLILDPKSTKIHSFEYYPGTLPSILSQAQDHWGYPTGRSNSLLPSFDLTENRLNTSLRDASPVAMTAGTLKKIQYPTGGYTDLVYEPHEYGYVGIHAVNENIYASAHWSVNAQKPEDPDASRYNTAYSSIIQVDGTLSDMTIDINFVYTQIPNQQQMRVLIVKPRFTSLTAEPIPENIISEEIIDSFYANSANVRQSLMLPNGRYFMKAVTELNVTSIRASLDARRFTGVLTAKKAGGLRIKEVINHDIVTNKKLINRYFYTETDNSRSSGVLVTAPVYETEKSLLTGELVDPDVGSRKADMILGCEADLIKRWKEVRSSSVVPLGETSGSHIGYKRVVTEQVNEQGAPLGKTIETFTSANQFPDEPKKHLGSSGTNRDWLRGKLLNQLVLDVTGNKVKETFHAYDFHTYKSFRSLVLASKYQMMGSATSLHICAFDFALYDNIVGKSLLKRTIVRDYITPPGSPAAFIEKKTSNYYEKKTAAPMDRAHIMPTKTVAWTSTGDSVVTSTTYAIDYTSDAVFNEMFLRHIISPVVETSRVKQKEQRLLYNSRRYYALFNGNPKLQRVEDRYNDSNDEKVIEFQAYDGDGRILQMTDRSGVTESYIWNLALSLPAARVANASLMDIYINDFENETGTSSPGDAHTGLKSHIASFTRTLTGLKNGAYLLSYWIRQSDRWVPVQSDVYVTDGTYTVSVTGQIDDLRFTPAQSQTISYIYSNDSNVISILDHNNIPSFYDYDGFGRLKMVRDNDGAVVKTYEYNLMKQ